MLQNPKKYQDVLTEHLLINWYKDIHSVFEKYGIGRAAWNYKEKDYGLQGEHYAPIINELVRYL